MRVFSVRVGRSRCAVSMCEGWRFEVRRVFHVPVWRVLPLWSRCRTDHGVVVLRCLILVHLRLLCHVFMRSRVLGVGRFIAGQRDICAGFKEGFPKLPTLVKFSRFFYLGSVTFEPSQTASECLPYCSTIGRMLVVTIRCARLKLWSISSAVSCVRGVAQVLVYLVASG